jgi:hypothetical protein
LFQAFRPGSRAKISPSGWYSSVSFDRAVLRSQVNCGPVNSVTVSVILRDPTTKF